MFKVIKLILASLLMMQLFADSACGADAENKYIYQIIVGTDRKPSILLSGFRLKGKKGILTSLHGVVGLSAGKAAKVSAIGEKSVYRRLKIKEVDLDNDLALLSSPDIEAEDDKGLEQGDVQGVNPGDWLVVKGHPAGITYTEKRVIAGKPLIKKLGGMIIGPASDIFNKRQSPFANIDVMYLDGQIFFGHSGAPVLTLANKVVGIANGGLAGGAAGISWAIPIDSMHLVSSEQSQIRTRIAELSDMDSRVLFNYQGTPEEKKDSFYVVLNGVSFSGNGEKRKFNPAARLGLEFKNVLPRTSLVFEGGGVYWQEDRSYSTFPGLQPLEYPEKNSLLLLGTGLKTYFEVLTVQQYVGGICGYSDETERKGSSNWYINLMYGLIVGKDLAVELRYENYSFSERKVQFNYYGSSSDFRKDIRRDGLSIGLLYTPYKW